MNYLKQFSPFRSLFSKLFLWFWLAMLVIFFSSIWLVKQLDTDIQYHPLNRKQQKDLSILTRQVQNQLSRGHVAVDLNKRIKKVTKRAPFDFVLVDNETRKITHNLPPRWQINSQVFESFNSNNTALVMDVKGMTLIGPSLVKVEGIDYLLFIVRPRPKSDLRVIRQEYPGLFVLLALTLSAGLCYLFVSGLLKPIAQLSLASNKMATGKLGVRVGNASNRVDEIGQLGRDFNHMSEQVENLLNSQKRLLADISHELRSPLTRLQLSIGIALQNDKSEIPSNILTALERIEKESLQIEDMLARVLLLSKLENNQPILNQQHVALDQIMQPLVEDAQFEAAQRNKTLNYHADENINLLVDQQLLSGAIENIIRNAIHYSNHKTSIHVVKRNKQIVWIIEDDGHGIEESQLQKIFDAFYRESSARERNSGGVGLGLAIAKHAIEKHQGSIDATNKTDGGLRVEICIPTVKEI